jgi:hypothetical protein
LTSLQQRLVKTGGRLIKHARYYWLLLAESRLTRGRLGACWVGLRHSLYQQDRRNGRSKQIWVPVETREGKMSEKRVREVHFGTWDFHLTGWTGSELQNVAGTLPTAGDRYTLWVGREAKTEIPDETLPARRPRERVCLAGPFSSPLEVCNAFGF